MLAALFVVLLNGIDGLGTARLGLGRRWDRRAGTGSRGPASSDYDADGAASRDGGTGRTTVDASGRGRRGDDDPSTGGQHAAAGTETVAKTSIRPAGTLPRPAGRHPLRKWRNWQTHQLEGPTADWRERGGSNPPFRTTIAKGPVFRAFFISRGMITFDHGLRNHDVHVALRRRGSPGSLLGRVSMPTTISNKWRTANAHS